MTLGPLTTKLVIIFLLSACTHKNSDPTPFEPHFGARVSPEEIDQVIDFVDVKGHSVAASGMPALIQDSKVEEKGTGTNSKNQNDTNNVDEAENQINDFGKIRSHIKVKICQLSGVVGRGGKGG